MEIVFTNEELEFIKTMLEDELFSYSIKRNKIEDYKKVKAFDEFIKPRKEFMEELVEKINKQNNSFIKI